MIKVLALNSFIPVPMWLIFNICMHMYIYVYVYIYIEREREREKEERFLRRS